MTIKFTIKEAHALKKIMDSADENGSKDIEEMLKDNKIVSYTIGVDGVTVEVKAEYMEEFLNVYARFVSLFAMQVKALVETVNVFKEEAEHVINKYNKEEEASHGNE